MKKFWTALRLAVARLAERDCLPDGLEGLDAHMLDDLPPYHPPTDRRQPC